jgi:hypothetical protein
VPQHILSDVGHVLGCDSSAGLKEGELMLYDPKLALSDVEVLGHEIEEGIHLCMGGGNGLGGSKGWVKYFFNAITG